MFGSGKFFKGNLVLCLFKCNLRLQGLDKRRRGLGLAAGILRKSHQSEILPYLIV